MKADALTGIISTWSARTRSKTKTEVAGTAGDGPGLESCG